MVTPSETEAKTDLVKKIEETDLTALCSAVDRLRSDLAELKTHMQKLSEDRDWYLRAVHYLLNKDLAPMTEEEAQEIERDGLTLGDVIRELEAEFGVADAGR